MATPIEALQSRAKVLGGSLNTSSTAYTRGTAPTKKDLSLDTQLASVNKQIEDLRSKQIRNKWYGPSDAPAEDSGDTDGFLIKGLKALQKPLNAIAGTAQYALGKGTAPDYVTSVNNALKTGTTFGDVLKQEGVPRGAQVPLGFALDVMFDPVNWLTAGTAALIPRVGTGLVKGLKTAGIKGAMEAAQSGLTSGLEKKAFTALNMVPFAKSSTKYANLAEKVGQKAIVGAEKYDTLIGKNVYDRLGRGVFGETSGIVGKTAEELVNKIPSTQIFGKNTPSGEKIVDFFKYSTRKQAEIADLKDKVVNLAKNKGAILTRSEEGASFQDINEFLDPKATIGIKDKTGEILDVAIRDADGVLKPDYMGQTKVLDSFENAQALLETAKEDYNLKHLVDAYKVTPMGKTGVQWYDDVIDKLKSTTVDDVLHARLGPGDVVEQVKEEADDLVQKWNSYGKIKDMKPLQRLLNAQRVYNSIFKMAKVPMNVGSHVVANIGNLFMGAMMGLPVYKGEYLSAVGKGSLLVKGRLGAKGIKETFFNDLNSWADFLDKNPNRFRQLTGIDPSEIKGKLDVEQKIMGVLGTTFDEVKSYVKKAFDDIEKGSSQIATAAAEMEAGATKIGKAAIKEKLRPFKTASETLQEMTKEGSVRQAELPSTWAATETPGSEMIDKVKNYLAEAATKNPNNPVARAANTIVNSMPRWYEHIDQSFKIGTTDYLSRVGLTEQELVTISRTVPITKDDLLEPLVKGGEKLYRLTPLKAAEVSTEAYMNYAGMPDFIKVMRALPVVGSPFFSFPYAMAVKTGKTVLHNPALFNKVGFMLNEMNTARTPQEKAAMEEKYNQYLKSPTVMKIFGMWNTDVKNFIPYYTMNMFNPSERKYDDSTQGQMLKMADKFPILQDPVGQVIKDFFIQPWLLSGSGQIPQGQFGQPLYPSYDEQGRKIEAGLGTKAFYAGRTLAETVVPGALSYTGLFNAPLGLSPEAVDYIPSYGARSIANATQGRSSIGAMTKEDAIRKTLRTLLGRTGVPAYTLDATKTLSK